MSATNTSNIAMPLQLPPQLFPERVAADSLRGYLAQTLGTVACWLDLGPSELLLCEGDEDIDRLVLDSSGAVQSLHQTQLKDIAAATSARDERARESIHNFLRSFVFHRKAGRKTAFTFRSTGKRAAQSISPKHSPILAIDVLATWTDLKTITRDDVKTNTRVQLITSIKALLNHHVAQAPDRTRAAQEQDLAATLAFMDEKDSHWPAFIDSVVWHFEADSLGEMRAALVDRLASSERTNHLPADTLLARLIVKVLETGCRPKYEDRVLTSDDLRGELTTTTKQLEAWSVGHHGSRLIALFATLDERLAQIETRLEAVEQASVLTSHELDGLTKGWEDDVATEIGGQFCLARPELVTEALRVIGSGHAVALLGESGSGKSAIARRLLARAVPRVALDAVLAVQLERTRSPKLSELLARSPTGGIVVLDSVERLADGDFSDARAVIRASLSAGSCVIVSCQSAHWNTVREHLRRALPRQEAFLAVAVQPLTEADCSSVRHAIPELAQVLATHARPPFLELPKVLDILATGARHGLLLNGRSWLGHSDIIRWLMQEYLDAVDRAPTAAAELLARHLNDLGVTALPLSEHASIAQSAKRLEAAGIVKVHDGAIRFTHDLYRDYASAHLVLANLASGNVRFVADRLVSRAWLRSIELAFGSVLDACTPETILSTWRNLRQRLIQAEPASLDVLLDASWLCARPGLALRALTPLLLADKANLARRLLTRFRYVASVPHEAVVDSAAREGRRLSLDAATRFRTPVLLASWLELLRWMHEQRRGLVAVASREMVELLETWLLWYRDSVVPMRAEAAELVLELAEADLPRRYPSREHRRRLFVVLLAIGASRLVADPRFDVVIDRLCGRLAPAPEPPPSKRTLPSHVPQHLLRRLIERERVGPWPLGPLADPDEDFANAALSAPGATWLVARDAMRASTIFLALLINPPEDRDPMDLHRHEGELRDSEETTASRDFAPLVALLKRDVAAGLSFAVAILDFAADRVEEAAIRRGEETGPVVTLFVEGSSHTYVGGARGFAWNLASHGPQTASTTAMTLEHWLAEHAVAGSLDAAWVRTLLTTSHSAAMLSVLFNIALLDQTLLDGPLESFLTAPELHVWAALRQFEQRWSGGPLDRGHLQRDILAIAREKWFARNSSWPLVDEARGRYAALLSACPDHDLHSHITGWLAAFDPVNWVSSGIEEPTFTPPPELLAERAEEASRAALALELMTLPIRCEQICARDSELSDEAAAQLATLAGRLD